MFNSGIPPVLLDITGIFIAIASNAANPKDSVSDGNKNTSPTANISFGFAILPTEIISLHVSNSLHSLSIASLSGPSPTKISLHGIFFLTISNILNTSSTRFTFLKFET